MSGPANDDSIRESPACVSLPYHYISFTLEESLLCLPGMTGSLLVSVLLISSREMESALADVSSEMALTGRSHSDNKLSPVHFQPSSPPSHPFPHKFLFPFLWLYCYFPFAVSFFPCLSSICLSLTTFSLFGNRPLGMFVFWTFGRTTSKVDSFSYVYCGSIPYVHCFESVPLCSLCSRSHLPLILLSPDILFPSLPSSLRPYGIELLIAFSLWKSLTSFVRALLSKSMSGCCSGGIRIGQYTGGGGL